MLNEPPSSPSANGQRRFAVIGMIIGLCLGGGILWLVRSSRPAAPKPNSMGLVRDQTGRAFPAAELAALMRAAQAQTQATSRPNDE